MLDAGAEVSIDGALSQEPLASHQPLQGQRKEVRGPWTSGGPIPETPLCASPQSLERGSHLESLTEGQASRGRGAFKHGIFASPQCS